MTTTATEFEIGMRVGRDVMRILPVGSVINTTSGHRYTKQADGTWRSESTGTTFTVDRFHGDSYILHTLGQARTYTQGQVLLTDAMVVGKRDLPIGTVVRSSNGALYRRQEGGTWINTTTGNAWTVTPRARNYTIETLPETPTPTTPDWMVVGREIPANFDAWDALPNGTVLRFTTGPERATKQADGRWVQTAGHAVTAGREREYTRRTGGYSMSPWFIDSLPEPEPEFAVGQRMDGNVETVERLPVGSRVVANHDSVNPTGNYFEKLASGRFVHVNMEGARSGDYGAHQLYTDYWKIGYLPESSTGPVWPFVVGQELPKTVEALDSLPVGAMIARTITAGGVPGASGGWVKRTATDWQMNTGGAQHGGPEEVLRTFRHVPMLLRSLPVFGVTEPEPEREPLTTDETVKVLRPQFTLRQFQQRFATTVSGRQQANGTSETVVQDGLRQMGVPDEEVVVGMFVHSRDANLLYRLPDGTVVTFEKPGHPQFRVYGKRNDAWRFLAGEQERRTRPMGGYGAEHAGRVTSIPGQEAAPWTTEVPDEAALQAVEDWKRNTARVGRAIQRRNSYCPQYDLGVRDADLFDTMPITPEQVSAMSEGMHFVVEGHEGQVLVVRDDRADNPARTRRIGGEVEGSWGDLMRPLRDVSTMDLGPLLEHMPDGSNIENAYFRRDGAWDGYTYTDLMNRSWHVNIASN